MWIMDSAVLRIVCLLASIDLITGTVKVSYILDDGAARNLNCGGIIKAKEFGRINIQFVSDKGLYDARCYKNYVEDNNYPLYLSQNGSNFSYAYGIFQASVNAGIWICLMKEWKNVFSGYSYFKCQLQIQDVYYLEINVYNYTGTEVKHKLDLQTNILDYKDSDRFQFTCHRPDISENEPLTGYLQFVFCSSIGGNCLYSPPVYRNFIKYNYLLHAVSDGDNVSCMYTVNLKSTRVNAIVFKLIPEVETANSNITLEISDIFKDPIKWLVIGCGVCIIVVFTTAAILLRTRKRKTSQTEPSTYENLTKENSHVPFTNAEKLEQTYINIPMANKNGIGHQEETLIHNEIQPATGNIRHEPSNIAKSDVVTSDLYAYAQPICQIKDDSNTIFATSTPCRRLSADKHLYSQANHNKRKGNIDVIDFVETNLQQSQSHISNIQQQNDVYSTLFCENEMYVNYNTIKKDH